MGCNECGEEATKMKYDLKWCAACLDYEDNCEQYEEDRRKRIAEANEY